MVLENKLETAWNENSLFPSLKTGFVEVLGPDSLNNIPAQKSGWKQK